MADARTRAMLEECPNCSQHFDGRDNRTNWSPLSFISQFVRALPNPGAAFFQVSCPYCGEEFKGRTLRYFGWLSYLRYFALLVLLFATLVACSYLFWGPR